KEIVPLLDGVVRNAVAAERRAIGGPERFVAEGLVGDARPSAQRLGPLVHEPTQASRLEAGDERDLASLLGLEQSLELVGEPLLPRVPCHGLARHERAAVAVGMVEPLQRGLTANAESPRIHGMIGVPLELDQAAV